MFHARWHKRALHALALGILGALVLTGTTLTATAAPTVRFGVPGWPGVTVQSQVAADVLDAMGYRTRQVTSSPAFILKSIAANDLDVYLGGWVPTEKGMIDPLVQKKEAVVLTTNLSGAIAGLAVPAYVWDAGVHTEADLAKFADKFNHKIYGIEAGSGFNKAVLAAIKANRHGLGDWKLVASSTSAMLAQVADDVPRKQWIVFDGWKPHSMNIRWHIKYLKAVGNSQIAEIKSNVVTVVSPQLLSQQPEAARFLKQFQIANKTMSGWIYQDKYKKRQAKEVASEWIGKNLDTVAKWLDGVKGLDGKPAIDAVRAKYGS